MSRLELIVGPMMASKSTELITRLSKYAALGLRILYINSSLDTRSSSSLSTHNPTLILSSFITSTKADVLSSVDISFFDVIGIDEGQFFSDLLLAGEWANTKHVIVAGLDGDAEQRQFGQMINLLPLADEIVKLNALCKSCFRRDGSKEPAPFTMRVNSQSQSAETNIDIGGADKYEAVCRKCLLARIV